MSDNEQKKNGGARRGSGRPRDSRNKRRPMVEDLRRLNITTLEGLVNHYHDLQRLIRNAKQRDDPRDASYIVRCHIKWDIIAV